MWGIADPGRIKSLHCKGVSFMTTSAEVCIPNINTAERRKRLTFGIFAFIAALVLLWLFVSNDLHPTWRLLLFMPFAGAASGFFQWKDQTCVGFAAQNARKIGEALEKIEDAGELAQVRKQAQRVQIKAAVAGVLLTLLTVLLPF